MSDDNWNHESCDQGCSNQSQIPQYEDFPTELLPEPLNLFVEAASKAIGRDPAFIALPLITAFGAAIGTTSCIELKPSWREFPIIWTGIIGESGTKKTPAIKTALHSFYAHQKSNHNVFLKEMCEYQNDKLKYDNQLTVWKKNSREDSCAAGDPPIEPGHPIEDIFLIGDSTVEAICDTLRRNPRGVLMVRDELAGWVNGCNQYKGHKGNDQQTMLEMHSASTIYVDRKSSGRIQIDKAALSITGGIQLSILKRVMTQEQFDNGLMARFLLAYPPLEPCSWSEEDVPDFISDRAQQVMEGILQINTSIDGAPMVYTFNDCARAEWKRFYNAHNKLITEQPTSELKAVYSKLEGYAARFALIIHCVRWVNDSDSVDQHKIDRGSLLSAIKLVHWFGRETARIYSMMRESESEKRLRQHLEWIIGKSASGSITAREFYRGRKLGKEHAELIFDQLAKKGYGSVQYAKVDSKGGQPSRIFVLNNFNGNDITPLRDNANEGIVNNSNSQQMNEWRL